MWKVEYAELDKFLELIETICDKDITPTPSELQKAQELLKEVRERLEEIRAFVIQHGEKSYEPAPSDDALILAFGGGEWFDGHTVYYIYKSKQLKEEYEKLSETEDKLRFFIVENRPIE